MKKFPIQAESRRGESGNVFQVNRIHIPWAVAEIAYEEYVRSNGDRQSLERLAERGGFGRDELLHLLEGAAS